MENDNTREGLLLTRTVMSVLLKKIIDHFTQKYKIKDNYTEAQLFGFGNFDEEKASLKSDFETLLKGYVNGKYLYNKSRELSTGVPFVKISRDYKYLFFNYLGYNDIGEFLDQDFFTPSQKSKQLETQQQENNIEDYFYVCYYFGEDKRMNKGQVVIYKQWRNVEFKYVYENKKGQTGVYSHYGTIAHSEGFVFFDTKFYVGSKKNEGAKFIFFVGKSAPHERKFLIGTYAGLDKYDNTIAGKVILKKVDSRTKMEEEVSNKLFDPIFSQELNKKRIVVESIIKKNPLLFSESSPYAQILRDIAKKYLITFNCEQNNHKIKVKIEKSHLNIKSLNSSFIIEQDQINLIHNGQIINLEFAVKGLFFLQKASIYIKTFELLNNSSPHATGKFTAVDLNNDIVSGVVEIKLLDK